MQNFCGVGTGVGAGDGQLSSQFVSQVYTDSSAQPVLYTVERPYRNPWVTVGVGVSHVSRVVSQLSS